MYQELQYLRDELNKRLGLHFEHGQKTINTVLIVWGGALTLVGMLGMRGTAFTVICSEHAILCFGIASIFFISNVILYSLARKYYDSADFIFKIGAYILVFYEKRPSRSVKVGENFCWESTMFEMMTQDVNNVNMSKNHFYKRNDEYKMLILISLMFIGLLSLMPFWATWKALDVICNFPSLYVVYMLLSILCIVYIVHSTYLYCNVQKYTSLKNNYAMRAKHLKEFFQYSIDTQHYTEEEIKNRFGNIYENCKRYL
jgi:uncharacterized membrane protein YeiB